MKAENIGCQSPWIADLYNKFFPSLTDGFFVEIGVGFTLNWHEMGKHPCIVTPDQIIRGSSNTIEFLEHGWSGIFIDPLEELLTNELHPLLNKILTPEQRARAQIVNCAASDCDKTMVIGRDQELGAEAIDSVQSIVPYQWTGRKIKCRKTSDIFTEYNVPNIIDVMSIDVEGHELNVIRGMDFLKHIPKFIVIEIDKVPSEKIMELLPNGYKEIQRDGLNMAVINEDLINASN